jgi:hypothetical protein
MLGDDLRPDLFNKLCKLLDEILFHDGVNSLRYYLLRCGCASIQGDADHGLDIMDLATAEHAREVGRRDTRLVQ